MRMLPHEDQGRPDTGATQDEARDGATDETGNS